MYKSHCQSFLVSVSSTFKIMCRDIYIGRYFIRNFQRLIDVANFIFHLVKLKKFRFYQKFKMIKYT